jgi:ATP adenylyltransferase
MERLGKGTLWQLIVETTARAAAKGVLLPVPTDYAYVQDGGIRFIVRILTNLARKDEERQRADREHTATGMRANPFLPYEDDLFVSAVSPTHVALLNKFNVMNHHLLIVTRQFEDQEALLTPDDFGALWACMGEFEGIGFYNGGEAAGASQPHKHLQMVPLPLASEGPGVPIEPLLASAGFRGRFGTVPGFPFTHSFVRLDESLLDFSAPSAAELHALYEGMLGRSGVECRHREGVTMHSCPYCLLVTRQWMLLVPRSRECFEGISINSLGFAGALLVRSEAQLQILVQRRPMTALREVTLPR